MARRAVELRMLGGVDEGLEGLEGIEGIEAIEVGLVGGGVGVGDVARGWDLEMVDEGLDVIVRAAGDSPSMERNAWRSAESWA